MTPYELIRGASGRLRCRFNVRVADEDDPRVAERWRTCSSCEHAQWSAKRADRPVRCGLCRCPLACALRVPDKPCPAGKFGEFSIEQERLNETDGRAQGASS